MHRVLLVEELNFRSDGHLDVIAVLENESRHKKSSFLFTAPDFAPIRASTILRSEALPVGITFANKSRQELHDLIGRHQLFLHQQWYAIDPAKTKSHQDDHPGGRLFF